MDEKEYGNIYAIPANYTDSGKILGGMLEPRNAVETGILLVIWGYPELMLIPMSGQVGMYSYEDLFQIGSIGLCKAAATDKGGTFSTYAYRLIWNEICDAMIYATRRQVNETICDVTPYIAAEQEVTEEIIGLHIDIEKAIIQAKADAPPSTAKGIEAMCLMAEGYTSSEIGRKMNASAKLVCAWVSKARKFLKERPEMMQIKEAYHSGV